MNIYLHSLLQQSIKIYNSHKKKGEGNLSFFSYNIGDFKEHNSGSEWSHSHFLHPVRGSLTIIEGVMTQFIIASTVVG